MKIWTWNVNSIRPKIARVNALLNKHSIDVLILTETKIKPEHETMVAQQIDSNYLCLWNSNKNSYYHGVGIIYRNTLNVSVVSNYLPRLVNTVDQSLCCMKNKNKIITSLNDTTRMITDMTNAQNKEGRILVIKCITKTGTELIIVGTYVPNSGVTRGDTLKRLGYRVLIWDKDIYEFLSRLERKYSNVIWVGDLNVARKSNDMSRKADTCAGTTPEEIDNMNKFLEKYGWIDTWDYLNQNVTDYHERWTYGVEKGRKLRLDYLLCSSSLKNYLNSSMIDYSFKDSDHVPTGTSFII